MAQLIVVADNQNDVHQLMKPFNLERVVPHKENIEDVIQRKKLHLAKERIKIINQYKSRESFIEKNKANPKYVEHIVKDVPMYLDDTKEGVKKLWQYIRSEYGIREEDLLPNNTFLRRFNPNGKWDHYVIQEDKEDRMVENIKDKTYVEENHVLLPNTLWLDKHNQIMTLDEKWDRLQQFKQRRYYIVTFNN